MCVGGINRSAPPDAQLLGLAHDLGGAPIDSGRAHRLTCTLGPALGYGFTNTHGGVHSVTIDGLRAGFGITALPLFLVACALPSSQSARSWLDERTAATVTAQEPTAVLAHEEQMRATNARDYVQVGAVEINQAGSRRYYLVLLSWSTIDRTAPERDVIDGELARSTLWADDRPIQLQRLAAGRPAVGIAAPPYAAPAPAAVESWYPITLSEIGALGRARTMSLTAQSGATARQYQLWQGNQHGFADFVRQVTHPH